jgi:hypothetical protein
VIHDLSGFVAHDVSGFIKLLSELMKRRSLIDETDGIATGDSENEI